MSAPPDKPKLSGRNAGKIQFLAIKSKIDALLDEGYSWVNIYEYFKEKEAFTRSYITFCRYMNGTNCLTPKKRKQKENPIRDAPKEQTTKQVEQVPNSTPVVLGSNPASFEKGEPIDPDELV